MTLTLCKPLKISTASEHTSILFWAVKRTSWTGVSKFSNFLVFKSRPLWYRNRARMFRTILWRNYSSILIVKQPFRITYETGQMSIIFWLQIKEHLPRNFLAFPQQKPLWKWTFSNNFQTPSQLRYQSGPCFAIASFTMCGWSSSISACTSFSNIFQSCKRKVHKEDESLIRNIETSITSISRDINYLTNPTL